MNTEPRMIIANVDTGPTDETPLLAPVGNFDPDPERDEQGRFASKGGGALRQGARNDTLMGEAGKMEQKAKELESQGHPAERFHRLAKEMKDRALGRAEKRGARGSPGIGGTPAEQGERAGAKDNADEKWKEDPEAGTDDVIQAWVGEHPDFEDEISTQEVPNKVQVKGPDAVYKFLDKKYGGRKNYKYED